MISKVVNDVDFSQEGGMIKATWLERSVILWIQFGLWKERQAISEHGCVWHDINTGSRCALDEERWLGNRYDSYDALSKYRERL